MHNVIQAYSCNHCFPAKAISRRRRLAIVELSHLLTRSGLTRLEVSFMVFPGFFCPYVCSSFLSSVISYEALFVCLNQFLMYCCILSKSGVTFCSFAICFLIINPSLFCCFSDIFNICCRYSTVLASHALTFSHPNLVYKF
jgi:hypothetical protein